MALRLLLLGAAVAGAVSASPISGTGTSSAVASAASPTVYIDTLSSTIQGNRSQYINSVYNFKAVPFASAPTGEWRWHHPQHVASWTGIRDATVFAPDCPQPGLSNTSEDCLYLNIWTPDTATLNDVANKTTGNKIGVVPTSTGSNLPVYIWIHGGRFSSGAASDPLYDGAGLASKGVVVITLNYRLGALGWLAHPDISADSVSGTSGNYGLVDQQAALHWINENIASFGGDPTRITIGGQSAGAASVLDHLNSELADSLFTQVIAESGAIYPANPMVGSLAESYRQLSEAETQGVAFLKSLNLSSVAEARAAPVELLLAGSNLNDVTFAGTVFQNSSAYSEPPLFRPVLDGYVLPATYQEMLQRGNHSIAPVLTGGNRDENGATLNPGLTASSYTAQSKQVFGSVGLADEYLSLYPAGNSSSSADAASNAFYQDQTRISSWLWANEYVAGSARNTSGNGTYQTYTYYWTHSPPGQDEGAYHGSEINYALNNLYATDSPWTAEDYKIADQLSSYWANFIRSGNPNGDGLEEWPVNSAQSPVVFEVGDAWKTVSVASSEKIAFLKKWFSKWTAY
ncbi:carboxylesterase [Aspergillus ellipticus CBS 707.79]|uniref:Carboxylic ester hydrolase n=1 Tax=Aspergillus ellipticus CBS 707.79 TaxID=1448320 RepID=A0A319D511_9EURO|nr:carboxylesterase [Aspergillus ellipticus CBS 707.79]